MKKPFLLIAGEDCYPQGRKDWAGCFVTRQDALDAVKVEYFDYFVKGEKRVGEVYHVDFEGVERECDWYEIVDLREWADG